MKKLCHFITISFMVVQLVSCTDSILMRSNYYSINKDFETANKMIDDVIKIDPDNYEAYNKKGCNFFRQGKYYDAIKQYDIALGIFPDNIVVNKNREAAIAYATKNANAIVNLERSLKYNSSMKIDSYNSEICIRFERI